MREEQAESLEEFRKRMALAEGTKAPMPKHRLGHRFSWWKATKKGFTGALVAGATAAALKAQDGNVKPADLQAAFVAGVAGFIVMAGRNWMKNR